MTAPAPRVGLVVVSHSPALADAAVRLALQMVGDDAPPLTVAAGTEDGGTGTDATRVLAALEEVGGPMGVLVLMDLGSAVLSAELALELAGDLGFEVRLSPAPFVEGLLAAVVMAAGGADLATVAAEAAAAGGQKAGHLETPESDAPAPSADPVGPSPDAPVTSQRPPTASAEVDVVNVHGLHARPAAAVVGLARSRDAALRLTDLSTGRGSADARSLVAVQTLGAGRGHRLRVQADGVDAEAAVQAMVDLVSGGFGELEPDGTDAGTPAPRTAPDAAADDTSGTGASGIRTSGTIRGVPGAAGLGVGPVWHTRDDLPPLPLRASGSPQRENRRLLEALATVDAQVRSAAAASSPEHRGIFEAHLLLVGDDALLGAARSAVASGEDAAMAWQQAVDAVVEGFARVGDEYLAARAADVRSVGVQVRRVLQGATSNLRSRPGVLVTTDLAPDDIRSLDPDVVVAVVTAQGSATSHAAILARAAGLPLVVGAGEVVLDVPAGTLLAVDGSTGELVVDPDPELRARWQRRVEEVRRQRTAAEATAAQPARTTDGVHVHVAANAAGTDDAVAAARAGADGIGLLRTELVFHGRRTPPSEDEQTDTYLAAAKALAGGRLVIRTMDIGGDKPVAYADQPRETNPYLGLRGVRLSLARTALFATQLRAVVRTAMQAPVGVMFPMVATVSELEQARGALLQAARDVGLDGLPEGLQVGIMVEVPAAALRARHLAAHVDFLSVGTNDLTQYVLAAERGNAHVAGLVDALDPTVLQLVDAVCRGAGSSVRVAVCGELAGDPLATAVLVGLGVRELSVAPRLVPEIKARVRQVEAAAAAMLASECLGMASAEEVRSALTAAAAAAPAAGGSAAAPSG